MKSIALCKHARLRPPTQGRLGMSGNRNYAYFCIDRMRDNKKVAD